MNTLLETRQKLHALIDAEEDPELLNEAVEFLSYKNNNDSWDPELIAEWDRRVSNAEGKALQSWEEVYNEISTELANAK